MGEKHTRQGILHNELAGQVAQLIVRPVIQTGGGFADILILLESAALGVLLFVARAYGRDPHDALNIIHEQIHNRLDEKGFPRGD